MEGCAVAAEQQASGAGRSNWGPRAALGAPGWFAALWDEAHVWYDRQAAGLRSKMAYSAGSHAGCEAGALALDDGIQIASVGAWS